jgi:SAM-dependent methyltransferase
MAIDPRIRRRYEVYDEDARLWAPGKGDLVRLRTWDIFDRSLPPPPARVLDVGGGPGTHAAHLAERGYTVTLVDPVERHVERATARSSHIRAVQGTALHLPCADGEADAVLLMGPLYHLFSIEERVAALRESLRALRPGGRLLAEVIVRHAWLLDAAVRDILGDPDVWASVVHSVETGLSQDPALANDDGAFWAWFHRPEELREEVVAAGFGDVELIGVEGFAWLLGDLPGRLADPEPLLRALRLSESEPTMLGCSAHVMAIADRPGGRTGR